MKDRHFSCGFLVIKNNQCQLLWITGQCNSLCSFLLNVLEWTLRPKYLFNKIKSCIVFLLVDSLITDHCHALCFSMRLISVLRANTIIFFFFFFKGHPRLSCVNLWYHWSVFLGVITLGRISASFLGLKGWVLTFKTLNRLVFNSVVCSFVFDKMALR